VDKIPTLGYNSAQEKGRDPMTDSEIALDRAVQPEDLPASDLAGVAPLSRRTLHDELVGRLRDMIIEGHLTPGVRVNESQLGAALGVSRTPLRESLKFLASEGLITLVPGRGAVVSKLTRKDIRDMLDVLSALESLAARLACRDATDAQIAELRRLHNDMMHFYAAGNRLEYYKCNQAFHSGVVRVSGNATLAAHHQAIQARLKRIRFIGNSSPENWAAAVAEHEEMIAALEARAAPRLAAILTLHMERTWERVQGII
jgi:DNA-binding GntR family transcriptional regulator